MTFTPVQPLAADLVAGMPNSQMFASEQGAAQTGSSGNYPQATGLLSFTGSPGFTGAQLQQAFLNGAAASNGQSFNFSFDVTSVSITGPLSSVSTAQTTTTSSQLSGGAIAGIVIGVLVAVVIIIAIPVSFCFLFSFLRFTYFLFIFILLLFMFS